MLEKSASFTPHLGLTDKNTSVFTPGWRSATGVMKTQFNDFASYDMRTAMAYVMRDLECHPLWLLMTISFHAGIYNPMLGYAENASWWHQVPPFMEAQIIYEIFMIVGHDQSNKIGKVVDMRAGN
jgi:hypothetical protein